MYATFELNGNALDFLSICLGGTRAFPSTSHSECDASAMETLAAANIFCLEFSHCAGLNLLLRNDSDQMLQPRLSHPTLHTCLPPSHLSLSTTSPFPLPRRPKRRRRYHIWKVLRIDTYYFFRYLSRYFVQESLTQPSIQELRVPPVVFLPTLRRGLVPTNSMARPFLIVKTLGLNRASSYR